MLTLVTKLCKNFFSSLVIQKVHYFYKIVDVPAMAIGETVVGATAIAIGERVVEVPAVAIR